jgi:general L-amino acid transport system permease protein
MARALRGSAAAVRAGTRGGASVRRRAAGFDLGRRLRNPKVRGYLYQAALVGAVALLLAEMARRALGSLAQRGVSAGFGFLANEAGFHISEAPAIPRQLSWALALVPLGIALLALAARLNAPRRAALRLVGASAIGAGLVVAAFAADWTAYEPSDSYLVAILTGIANTVRVGLVGCVLATVFGVAFGLFQLSSNWLLRSFAAALTDVLRNVPLLLIAMFWYALLLNAFPAARAALAVGGVIFLTNRGVYYPTIASVSPMFWVVVPIVVGGVATAWLARARTASGQRISAASLGLALGAAALAGLAAAATWDVPALRGFNFEGGGSVGPEFTALLVGLVLYHGAFVADIVRSGIMAVPAGQWEAGRSLGMSRRLILAKVVLPQALRVILPPLALQYLGLAKNTSIGVAIGFPELVSVSRTVLNQSGKAIEVMMIVLACYLAISLTIAGAMNAYNERAQIRER